MDDVTANEIAGLGVGALLFFATIAAPKLDSFISASQKRSLGMCKRCGDVRRIPCRSCKGAGSTRPGGSMFGLSFPADRLEPAPKLKPCAECRSRGHFPCPECCAASSSSSSA